MCFICVGFIFMRLLRHSRREMPPCHLVTAEGMELERSGEALQEPPQLCTKGPAGHKEAVSPCPSICQPNSKETLQIIPTSLLFHAAHCSVQASAPESPAAHRTCHSHPQVSPPPGGAAEGHLWPHTSWPHRGPAGCRNQNGMQPSLCCTQLRSVPPGSTAAGSSSAAEGAKLCFGILEEISRLVSTTQQTLQLHGGRKLCCCSAALSPAVC